jgi:PAS domain S-box-containing protein
MAEKIVENAEILLIKDSDYKVIFKKNAQAMIIHNIKGEIVDINDSALKMLGYSLDDLKKIKMESLIKRELRGIKKFNLVNLLKETIKKGGFVSQFEFIKKDKKTFLGEIIAKPVIFSKKLNVLMLLDNVTEKKILQDDVKRQKELLEKLIDSAPNIVIGLGKDSEIMIFNKFAERLTGYKANEVLGKKWIDIFIPKNERKNILKVWESVVKNKSIYYNYSNSIVTKDGEQKIISWNNSCILDDNEFLMVLSIGENITEKSKFQEMIFSSERMLKNTISSMADLVFVFNANKIFTYHHSPKNSILYSEPEFFIGKKISQVMPKNIVDKFDEAFEKTSKGAVTDFEYSLKIRGIKMNFHARLSPMSIGGSFAGCVAVVRHL